MEISAKLEDMRVIEKRLKEERIDPKLFLRFLMQSIKEELPSVEDAFPSGGNPHTIMRKDMRNAAIILWGIGGLLVSYILMILFEYPFHETWPFLLLLGIGIGKATAFINYLRLIGAWLEFNAISSAVRKGAFLGFLITFLITWNIFYSLAGAASGMLIMEKVGFACYRAKLESLRLKGLV